MEAGEQKLALFVDDILVYLSIPTDSPPELLSVLDEYGSYSGHKVNEHKTYEKKIKICEIFVNFLAKRFIQTSRTKLWSSQKGNYCRY